MSDFISDDSFTDGEESFLKCNKNRRNINQDEGVIDESVIDESAIIDDDDSDDSSRSDVQNQTSNLDDDTPVKKRIVKPLLSDTDHSNSENDNTACDILESSEVQSVAGRAKPLLSSDSGSDVENDSTSDDSSDDILEQSEAPIAARKVKSREKPPLSDSDDSVFDKDDTAYASLQPLETESVAGKPSPERGSKEESNEEDPFSSTNLAFIQSPKENEDGPADFEKSPDVLNLSAKLKNTRISNQFKFSSEGILNSTSVHPTAPVPGKWRPSIATTEIEDTEEPKASLEILSDDDSDIIEVSSVSSPIPPKTPIDKIPKSRNMVQPTLRPFIQSANTPPPKRTCPSQPKSSPGPITIEDTESPKKLVSQTQYEAQRSKLEKLEMIYVRVKSTTDNVDLDALPDGGVLLRGRLRIAKKQYKEEKLKFDNMKVSDEVQADQNDNVAGALNPVAAWDDLKAGANAVLPKTFGKQALSTYNAQKAVTMDRLEQLHGAIQTCPKEDDTEDDPRGLKVALMPHQRRALAWLIFREKEKPSGGILADDMGLGKTLTMICLILKSLRMERKNEDDSDEENRDRNQYLGKNKKFDGGTLVVCPASLLEQWSGEIDRRLKRGLISYNIYHGPRREARPKRLAEYDVVITTYAIVNIENDKNSSLFRIRWRRIILDEAHQIRNYKAQTSEACSQLLAKSRWALTGTPMHNKEMDLYALLRFLRCTPFDDLQVWKRWIGDKSGGGQERLHTVISSLMLRRTKVELMEKGTLTCLPDKQWLLVKVELEQSELQVYHKVLIFSQTLFAQFLHQRAEKNQDYCDVKALDNAKPNEEYFKMRQRLLRLNKVKNVSQHEILVLLLRLRQICCHPSLITAMLDEGLEDVGDNDEEREELNLLDQIKKLNIEDEHEDEYKPSNDTPATSKDERVNLKEATRGHLRPSDPVFAKERISSKIKQMLTVLKEEVLSKKDKAIIVSQWPSYLHLIAIHLNSCKVEFTQLDGQVPVHKRMDMIDRFNDPRDSLRILLLSLTAGGVGLNLVGANHLFLLDLHWNPQLENQAQDRIYRVGQQKPVFIYKFMAVDTIEERIKLLQEKKLKMAEGILTGTKQVVENKLSLQDIRMLFQM